MGSTGQPKVGCRQRWGGAARVVVALAVALTALAASPGEGRAAVTCTPAMNAPGGPQAGTIIAPYLRVVTSFGFGPSNCGALRIVGGTSASGLWAWDNSNGLWRSGDDGVTWTRTYVAAGYEQIYNVLVLSSGRLLILVEGTNGIYHVLRSSDATGTSFATVPVLDMPAYGTLLGSASWAEIGGAVYIAEYGDADPPIKLWKSTDGGLTFSVVYQLFDVRHFHSVQEDPYVPGRIWVCIGDNGAAPRVGYSDDGGHTFTYITQGEYPESRVVTLMFDAGAVYWGTDTPDVLSTLHRWDRGTGQVTTLLSGLNGPFYYGFDARGVHVQFSGVERDSDSYIGDQHYHVLSSKGGVEWFATRTSLMREPSSPATSNSVILGHTAPDAQGRFWVNFWNLAGTQYATSNIQFQIDPDAGPGPQAPTAVTDPTTGVTASAATLRATVTPNGAPTSTSFEYGATTAYGSQTSGQATGSGSAPVSVSAAVGELTPGTTYHYRAVATSSNGTTYGEDRTFTTTAPPPAPTAVTQPATAVTSTGATLNAAVDPRGSVTSVRFAYGPTSAYGSETPTRTVAPNLIANPSFETGLTGWSIGGTAPLTFARQTGWASDGVAAARYTVAVSTGYSELRMNPFVSGLAPGERYAASADVNVLGRGSAQWVVLYLAWRSATGASLGKTEVAATNATGVRSLAGSAVAPAGAVQASVMVTVEGAGTADLLVDNVRLVAGGTTAAQSVSADLAGLAPGTTYHYKVIASSAGGTVEGQDRTFTTTSAGPPGPTAVTDPATGVTSTAATLNGTVDPRGSATSVRFEYGTAVGYGAQTVAQDVTSNLVGNSGFEVDRAGWTVGGTTASVFERQTGWSSAGGASARYTVTVPAGGYSEARTAYITGIQPGTSYTGRMDVNVLARGSGQWVVLYLVWRNASGAGLGKVELGATNLAGVRALSGKATAPAGAVQAQLTMTLEGTGSADLYFDDVRLGAGAVAVDAQPIAALVSGLAPGTTYHYRVAATSAAGTTYGQDRTFTTAP